MPIITIEVDGKHNPSASKGDFILQYLEGNILKVLHNSKLAAGSHKIQWNGTNFDNQHVASGVYFYRLEMAESIHVNKMLLVR